MLRSGLALLAGGYLLHASPALPPAEWLLPSCIAALGGLCMRRMRTVALLALGFCGAWQASASVLAERLATGFHGETLTVQGTIADFPQARGEALRFLLEVRAPAALPRRVRLSWYEPETVPRLGESWRLQVRLRRPRGFANPIGFDYERWLFRQRIGATGYVVAGDANRRLDDVAVALSARVRRRIAERIADLCGRNDASAVLQAIVVGARHDIGREQWERYAASGTSHLIAISGLHIGLAAGAAFLFARCAFVPFCRWRNVRDPASVAAVLAACLYAGLSGFAVPAQRALLMAVLFAAAGIARRPASAAGVLAVTAAAVAIGDPLSLMAPGFMLSFAAVAILLWSVRQRAPAAASSAAGRWLEELLLRMPSLQASLLFGLMPLTVLLFGRVAWLSPLVNLAVLPVFSLCTVPAALLGALFDGPLQRPGDGLLLLAWHSIRASLWLIARAADLTAAHTHVAGAAFLVWPAAMLAAIGALLPAGWPGRRLAWLAGLAVLLLRPAAPPRDCVAITALDVGQGLAVVLRTARRTVLFDTGPAFRGGGDAGELVVVPWLRRNGIERIDLLLVSHADADHAGGAAAVTSAIEVSQVMAGERITRIPGDQLRCRRGQAWLWDGVRFAILHPGVSSAGSDNDRSCVLEVTVAHRRLLLTGDIEAASERSLLDSGSLSPADFVIVPHHGSGTSSGADFVHRLAPRVAVVSAGFGNRWGLPKEDVVGRWRQAGARVVNTATSGAIGYRMCAHGALEAVTEYRSDARRYWHDAPHR